MPYVVVAFVAAAVVWTYSQQDSGEPDHHRTSPSSPNSSVQSTSATPAPRDVRTIFSVDDYPAEAQRRGEQGTVQARLTVAPSGRVSNCAIIRSSGFPILDQTTCSILSKRALFAPPRDANGQPVADKVDTPPIVWRLES